MGAIQSDQTPVEITSDDYNNMINKELKKHLPPCPHQFFQTNKLNSVECKCDLYCPYPHKKDGAPITTSNCGNRKHNPPKNVELPPGLWVWICKNCGQETTLNGDLMKKLQPQGEHIADYVWLDKTQRSWHIWSGNPFCIGLYKMSLKDFAREKIIKIAKSNQAQEKRDFQNYSPILNGYQYNETPPSLYR